MTAGADRPVTDAEVAAMARALAHTRRARFDAPPNPAVGAVVLRGGEVVGEGWTAPPGGPHAEVRALSAAGVAARGATIVVTLEPCNHTGRTGPCSVAIREAGIARAVVATADPSAQAGGGAAHLREAGLDVVIGLYGDWAREVHGPFLHEVVTGRPHVRLKLAATSDGAMAVPARRWITGVEARRRVHRLRADADAVMVGIGTVLADDPRLDVRYEPVRGSQPRPVWVDREGATPMDARVVRAGGVVLTGPQAPSDWRNALAQRGVVVLPVPVVEGHLDLHAAMEALRGEGITRVLAEPGPRLAAALAAADLVDEYVLHTAPDVVGGEGLPTVPPALWLPGASSTFHPRSSRRLGRDREVVARPEVRTDHVHGHR